MKPDRSIEYETWRLKLPYFSPQKTKISKFGFEQVRKNLLVRLSHRVIDHYVTLLWGEKGNLICIRDFSI